MFVYIYGGKMKVAGTEVDLQFGVLWLGNDRKKSRFTVDESTLGIRWFETYQHCRCIDDADEIAMEIPILEESTSDFVGFADARLLAIVEEFSLGQLSLCARAIIGE